MIKFLKKILPEKLKQDTKDNMGVPSLSLLLKHLKLIGFTPDKVIDVGANEGNQPNEFLLYFSGFVILMVEAQ